MAPTDDEHEGNMTQPPDDQPRSDDQPPDAPGSEEPTVAWTPPADATPPHPDAAPPTPDAPAPHPDAPPPHPDAAPPAHPDAAPPIADDQAAAAPGASVPPTPTAPPPSAGYPTAPPPPPQDPEPAAAPPPPPAASPLLSASPTAEPSTAWSAPTAAAGREIAPGLVLSDTVSRVAGYVVDAFVVGIVSSIVGSALGMGSNFGTGGIEALTADFGYSVLTVAIGFVYFVVSWSGGRRATLGQRLFSIQVGNAFDGRPLTLEQAIRRWIGYGMFLTLFSFDVAIAGIAGLLQFVWVVVLFITTVSSPTKQGLHDKLANTALVRPATAGTGLAWGCLGILIALVVLAVVAVVAFGAAMLNSPEFQDLLRQSLEQA